MRFVSLCYLNISFYLVLDGSRLLLLLLLLLSSLLLLLLLLLLLQTHVRMTVSN